jgi:kinesin family protein 1
LKNLADRAKQIKTKAMINEDPTEKLIRDLREENARLKKALEAGHIDPDTFKDIKDNANGDKAQINGFNFISL